MRTRALLIPLLAVVALAAACDPPPPTEPGEATLIGDSILTLSAEEVADTLPDGWPGGPAGQSWTPYTEARNATGLTQQPGDPDWYPWAYRAGELVRTRTPDALVVVLGTNDTLHVFETCGPICDNPEPIYAQHIDRLMTKVAEGAAEAGVPVPRVLWLNASTHTAVWQRNVGAQQINTELQVAEGRWPTLEVVDWDSQVADDPRFGGPDSVHPGDGTEEEPQGQELTARLILLALRGEA